MRVLFYVQNLLGIGHILRALRIARAMAADGATVRLALGGLPVAGLDTAGIEVTQLPPVTAGEGGFADLVDAGGVPVDDAGRARRRDALLDAFNAARPDVLMIEAFPFGRRQMRFELLPLIEAAHCLRPRPLLVCSVRDILQQSRRRDRAEETVGLLRRRFDHVVVHGDPSIARLDDTFPEAHSIADITSYSGIVAAQRAPIAVPGATHDVIVSAGGGAVGAELIRVAIAAKPKSALSGARWLAVTGPNLPPADGGDIADRASAAGIAVERFVADLPAGLTAARLSISQAGYNTVADILVAGCRAVLVPFAAGGETEQTRRAELLAARGLATVVPESGLDAGALAAAVDRAMAASAPRPALALDGAAETARIVRALLGRR